MKAKSIKGSSGAEIQTALEESIRDGFEPTLAIVFLSMFQDHQAVTQFMADKIYAFSE